MALLAAAGAQFSTGAVSANAEDGGPLDRIASLPLNNAGRGVIVDAGARRAIVMCGLYVNSSQNDSGCSRPGSTIAAYDLDRRGLVATTSSSDFTNVGVRSYALDDLHHRLFTVGFPNNAYTIEVLDTRNLKLLKSASVSSVPNTGGFYYSAPDNLLYVDSFNTVTAYNADTLSTVWTLSLLQCAGSPFPAYNMPVALGETPDHQFLLTLCFPSSGQLTGNSSVNAVRVRLAANRSQAPSSSDVQLYPGIVTGGIHFDSLFVPTAGRIVVLVPSGNGGFGLMVFDGEAGEFVAAPGLFETQSNSTVQYTTPTLGVDPSSGRIYAQARAVANQGSCTFPVPSENRFAIAEAGLAQNATVALASGDAALDGGQEQMGFDPVTRNLWLIDNPYQPTSGCNDAPHSPDVASLVVFHDGLPPVQQTSSSDLDAGTQDIAEADGTTGASFGSQASSFGARYEMAPSGFDGPMTTVTNPARAGDTLSCDYGDYFNAFYSGVQSVFGAPALPAQPAPPPPQYSAFCNANNRAAILAHVSQVSIDAGEARATAIAGETNRETANDLTHGTDLSQPGPYVDTVTGYVDPTASAPCPINTATPTPGQPPQPTTCDQAIGPLEPYLTGEALPYAPASCDAFGGRAQQPSPATAPVSPGGTATGLEYPGSASAGCDFESSAASGDAEESGGAFGVPITMGSAIAHADVERTKAAGSAANATSTVRDIVVGPYLRIDRLITSADTSAHGRTGTNHAHYSCQVYGMVVTLPGQPAETYPNEDCQTAQAQVAPLDQLLTGTLDIEFPKAYADAATAPAGAQGLVVIASPHGYIAQVQRSALEQNASAILLNDQDALEEPGLVVTYYGDTKEARSRLIASFGGVAASSTYGIFDLGSALPPPDTNTPSLPALAPLPESGVAPVREAPTAPVAPAGPVSAPLPGPLGSIYQAIVDGVRFFGQNPQYIPALLAVWGLFASGPYLLSRRRALLRATEVSL